MTTNRFEVYEYMQPLVSLDEVNGEFITKRITLASAGTPSPFEMSQHTLWAKIPGGYWEYKNPWTKKALNLIISIQRDYDEGRDISKGMDWHHCSECGKWFNATFMSMCGRCYDICEYGNHDEDYRR